MTASQTNPPTDVAKTAIQAAAILRNLRSYAGDLDRLERELDKMQRIVRDGPRNPDQTEAVDQIIKGLRRWKQDLENERLEIGIQATEQRAANTTKYRVIQSAMPPGLRAPVNSMRAGARREIKKSEVADKSHRKRAERLIKDAIGDLQDLKTVRTQEAPRTASVPTGLKQLAGLYEKNQLTEDEFTRAKYLLIAAEDPHPTTPTPTHPRSQLAGSLPDATLGTFDRRVPAERAAQPDPAEGPRFIGLVDHMSPSFGVGLLAAVATLLACLLVGYFMMMVFAVLLIVAVLGWIAAWTAQTRLGAFGGSATSTALLMGTIRWIKRTALFLFFAPYNAGKVAARSVPYSTTGIGIETSDFYGERVELSLGPVDASSPEVVALKSGAELTVVFEYLDGLPVHAISASVDGKPLQTKLEFNTGFMLNVGAAIAAISLLVVAAGSLLF